MSQFLADMLHGVAGEAEAIKHEGCVTEYGLTPQGLTVLKSSPVFAGLKP